MKKKLILLVATFVLMLASAVPAFAASKVATGEQTGTVTVIHGVPGLIVDVYVNGALTLPNFAPDTVTDPLNLPEGQYDIEIVPAGGDPANPAISGSAFLPAGANVSIIAHLDANGAPKLSVFVNDLKRIKPWEARLVVRHTAAAPEVDVKLARQFLKRTLPIGTLSGLSNGEEGMKDVTFGRISAGLTLPGSNDIIFGPATLSLKARTVTIVYAVGVFGEASFKLLTQTIRVPHSGK
jgi:hypothetical protein